MHRLLFNKWTQFRAQGLFGHQIDRAAERDQDVDVAIAPCGVACGGTEQRKLRYPVTGRQYWLALGEKFKYACAVHCNLHSKAWTTASSHATRNRSFSMCRRSRGLIIASVARSTLAPKRSSR